MPIVEIVERAEKLHAAHHRHVPVKQDDVGTIDAAEGQRLLSIGRLLDGKGHAFKDMARDLANDFTVIDDQTRFRHAINSDPRAYERTSVVQGTRVTVGVDIGGRSTLNKKTITQKHKHG